MPSLGYWGLGNSWETLPEVHSSHFSAHDCFALPFLPVAAVPQQNALWTVIKKSSNAIRSPRAGV